MSLDDDDRFLIRRLFRKKTSIAAIAKKLGHNEDAINLCVQEFEKKGRDKYSTKKDYQESSFWYYQHKVFLLDGAPYARYNMALKQCEINYPAFGAFLEGERKIGAIKEESTWDEVQSLWDDKYEQYQDDDDNNVSFESMCGKTGGKTITVDVEELHMNAVCKIHFKDGNDTGCGSLIDIDGHIGVMTHHKVISTADRCKQAELIFETTERDYESIKLLPHKYFLTNEKLCTTFVACNYDPKEHEEIEPLKKLGEVEKDCPIYSYFHLEGQQKVSIQNKVQNISSENILYDGTPGKGICGAPLYCEDKLVGINHGDNETSSDFNTASGIRAISGWIQKNMVNSYLVGEKVMATWTDGFEYNAEIIRSTEAGYLVLYTDFDTKEDLAIGKIRKLEGAQRSLKSLEIQKITVTKTPTSTTTTTTTTITTTNESSTADMDDDDMEMIMLLHQKGTAVSKIAKKLNHSEEAVQRAIENTQKKLTNQNVNPTQSQNFDEAKFRILVQWLKDMNCDKYQNQFKKLGFITVEIMMAAFVADKVDFQDKLEKGGIKHGSVMKILRRLSSMKAYASNTKQKSSTSRIQTITNTPMAEDWEPEGDDERLNLTDELKKPDGKASINYASTRIRDGYIPHSIEPGTPHFYMFSTRYGRFFKIILTWKD